MPVIPPNPSEPQAATIIQVSDTHLSARHGWFAGNWRNVVRAIHDAQPDLVVNSGDLSVNGAVDEADLTFALAEHRRLSVPWRAVPGNHDVGEEPDVLHVGQPIDATSVDRYRRAVGPDRWTHDLAGWRLIGLNGLLIGTGMAEEDEQHRWLAEQLRSASAPIGLFLHKPLFIDDPSDTSPTTRAVLPAARSDLLELLASSMVRFVASGHLHRTRIAEWNGITIVWAPSTAFPAKLNGERAPLGWVEHRLDGQEHSARIVELDELQRFDLDELKGNGTYQFLHQTPDHPAPVTSSW